MKKLNKDVIRFTFDVPTDVHKKLKTCGAIQGITMRQIIIKLLTASMQHENIWKIVEAEFKKDENHPQDQKPQG